MRTTRRFSSKIPMTLALAALIAVAIPPRADAQVKAKPKSAPAAKGKDKPSPAPDRKPALAGYDPTSYLLQETPILGDPAINAAYRGDVFYFADAQARKKFVHDPERFWPRLGGLCTTALGGSYGNRFKGDETVYTIHDGKLYLFSSERAKRAFDTRPAWFAEGAEEVYARPRLGAACVVSYQKRKKAVTGSPQNAYPYRRWTYWFVDKQEKAAFIAHPEVYLPQYNTYCTEAMSRGELRLGDPKQFVVIGKKTFLFFDDVAQMKFQANPAEMIPKADAQWEVVRKRPEPDPGH